VLHFHSSTEHLHCWTLHVGQQYKGNILLFPYQQCLRECTTKFIRPLPTSFLYRIVSKVGPFSSLCVHHITILLSPSLPSCKSQGPVLVQLWYKSQQFYEQPPARQTMHVWHNTVQRSRNHCCGKACAVLYSHLSSSNIFFHSTS
jgi:hypothetical protein